MPPRSTVPPSGTLTVVVTVTNENCGNWTVVPVLDESSSALLEAALEPDFESLDFFVVELDPLNVNVSTSPIWLKNGTTVNRTNRRSFETTACTVSDVPCESTTITGCSAAAKSPTTGMTLVTNGTCVWSAILACCPLKRVTFGASGRLYLVAPCAAWTTKNA